MALDFDHKHYVPILKTKAGERWAIANLSSDARRMTTPLLELHSHANLSPADHAENTCEALETVWGTDVPFFFDTIWLHGEEGNPAIIEAVFASARNHGLLTIPVVRLSYSDSSREQIRAVVDEDERGCMLRVKPQHLNHPPELTNLLDDLGLSAADVHLILDYRGSQMNLPFDIPRIPELQNWRSLTAASGSFPHSLAHLPINTWHSLPRNDWTSWENQVTGNGLARIPAFSDYTTRDFGAPPSGGQPSVNLRYTSETEWLVRVGGKVNAGASPQMKAVCQSLIERDEYSGEDYSAGDAAIHETAQQESGPGNTQQWAMWGISHHLEFASEQIRNNSDL
jgi:hypothetical protein